MLETSTAHSLLALDPDLGQLLSAERSMSARRELTVRPFTLQPGPWRPDAWCAASSAANVGLLVLDGAIAREVWVHDAPSAELFGPGDIIRTWQAAGQAEILERVERWVALGQVSVALMDAQCAAALRRYPEVMAVVLDRVNARAERLGLAQAISQITGVEVRVEALLWHVAERWGRVGADGVIVSLPLSHRMLGSLIGARRPTVSSAVARLAEQQRVIRRADGTWLLTAPAPPLAVPATANDLALDGSLGERRPAAADTSLLAA